MIPLEQQVCSRPLAERLEDLGALKDGVHWWYQERTPKNKNLSEYGTLQEDIEWRLSYTGRPGRISTSRIFREYPAPTVAELAQLFPPFWNLRWQRSPDGKNNFFDAEDVRTAKQSAGTLATVATQMLMRTGLSFASSEASSRYEALPESLPKMRECGA